MFCWPLRNLTIISNVFWQHKSQRQLARTHGSLLFIDATYQTNQQEWPLTLAMTVDGEGHQRLLAQMLSARETSRDMEFFMHHFLQSCPGIEPGVIMSDRAAALKSTLQTNFPSWSHLFCIFHIKSNIRRECNSLALQPAETEQVLKLVDNAVYADTKAGYEGYVMELRTFVGLLDTPRIQAAEGHNKLDAYLMNHIWAADEHFVGFHTSHLFVAGHWSTQRVESLHHQVKRATDRRLKTTSLPRVLEIIDAYLDSEDRSLQYTKTSPEIRKSRTSMPASLREPLAHLIHFCDAWLTSFAADAIVHQGHKSYACSVYPYDSEAVIGIPTAALPPRFQPEVIDHCYAQQSTDEHERAHWFRVVSGSNANAFTVYFHPQTGSFMCSCNLPTRSGIPCEHYFATARHFPHYVFFTVEHVHSRYWTEPIQPDFVIRVTADRSARYGDRPAGLVANFKPPSLADDQLPVPCSRPSFSAFEKRKDKPGVQLHRRPYSKSLPYRSFQAADKVASAARPAPTAACGDDFMTSASMAPEPAGNVQYPRDQRPQHDEASEPAPHQAASDSDDEDAANDDRPPREELQKAYVSEQFRFLRQTRSQRQPKHNHDPDFEYNTGKRRKVSAMMIPCCDAIKGGKYCCNHTQHFVPHICFPADEHVPFLRSLHQCFR